MKAFSMIVLLVASTAWSTPPPPAGAGSAGGDPWAVCHADMDRLCPGSAKNEGSAIRCFIPNESKLSEPCKKFFLARKREALKDWPCAEDAEKLCKNAPNEPGAVGSCLLKQREKLSPKCREFHDQAAQKLKQHAEKVKAAGKNVPMEGVPQSPPPGQGLPVPK